jgi:hypothetical protein
MKKMKNLGYTICLILCCLGYSCKKYLNEKPDTALAIPETATDFQALIDNVAIMNFSPGGGEISSDNYYLTDADYTALSQENYRREYTWQKDYLFSLLGNNDWFNTYRPVFTCNTVLAGVGTAEISPSNQKVYDNIRGEAYFARAQAFYQAADLWAPAYDEVTASTQLGIPIRLGIDFNQKSARSTVEETYAQIVSDLKSGIPLLPAIPAHQIRASKPAAYALLSRVYLAMGKYNQAGLYADSSLKIVSTLIDYNKVSISAAFPFAQFNAEVIREAKTPVPAPLNNSVARIDSQLYAAYAPNDLRKKLFFKTSTNGTFVFKGSYEGSRNLFSGIATDEVYLIRAECYARAGKVNEAMSDLNTLLVNRYKTGTFVPLSASNSGTALNYILLERRKELLMRGLRWMDLKRLNREGMNIRLTRQVAGQTYTLLPNDLRYALPIPEDILQITGMPQNPR